LLFCITEREEHSPLYTYEFVSCILPPSLRLLRQGRSCERRGDVMGSIRKGAARQAAPREVDDKILEERQRIAEHLVRELRKAGFECSLGDDSSTARLKHDH
jgi:hypothetical protein